MADIILFSIYVKSMPSVGVTLFWAGFSILFYTYIGYPLLLILAVYLKRLICRPQPPTEIQDVQITLIVSAYNEEEVIEQKIINTLELDYHQSSIQFIFITDGSTDQTPEIVRKYRRILHLHDPVRRGKAAAQNRAMEYVNTPFVIFSDANGFLNPQCIRNITRHYSDPHVGGVTGEKKIIKDGERNSVSQGEGLYWIYESFLKKLDSKLYSVVGAAGELFSIRTNLYVKLPENTIIEDFVQSLQVCMKHKVIRYEPSAISAEKASSDPETEMERKIRIAAGGFQAMGMLKGLFNIFRYPLLSFQFISHRVLRWTICPVALVIVFLSSIAIMIETGSVFFIVATILQLLLYSAAFAGYWLSRENRHIRILHLPFYFVFMNFCVFAGFYRFITGKQSVLWQKSPRNSQKI